MTIQFLGSFVRSMGNVLFWFVVFANFLHCHWELMNIVHEKRNASLLHFIPDAMSMLALPNSWLALSPSTAYNYPMRWRHLGLFHKVIHLCALIGAVCLTRSLSVAYTPPFEGKYRSGTMDGGNVYYPFYKQEGAMYNKMKAVWGSDLKVFEKIRPGAMVDSTGTLYYIMPDMGTHFGGKGFYTGKITPSGVRGYNGFQVDECISNSTGQSYTWDPSKLNTIEDNTVFSNTVWPILAPCMAQEEHGPTNYVHVVVYVPPSRWWNTSSGPDTEGFLLLKLRKSDLGGEADFIKQVSAVTFGNPANTIYNRNCFCAYHDAAGPNTTILYLSESTAGYSLEVLFKGAGSFAGMTVTGGVV